MRSENSIKKKLKMCYYLPSVDLSILQKSKIDAKAFLNSVKFVNNANTLDEKDKLKRANLTFNFRDSLYQTALLKLVERNVKVLERVEKFLENNQ